MPDVTVEVAGSRAATDALLAELRNGRWRPRAWVRFFVLAAARSAGQIWAHPRAAAELTLIHAAVLAAARGRERGRGSRWAGASWLLSITHLGLLEDRFSIGPATALTLLRAHLPVLAPTRWAGILAIVSDLADGRLARRRGETTAFGAYADSLADAAFWTWFTRAYEPDRRVRALATAAWILPVAAVTALSLANGGMIDRPYPVVLRPAAAMQAVMAIRAVMARRGES